MRPVIALPALQAFLLAYLHMGFTARDAQSALGFTTQPWGPWWAVRQCWDSGTTPGAAAALHGGQGVNMVPRTLEIISGKLHLTGTVTEWGLGSAHQSLLNIRYVLITGNSTGLGFTPSFSDIKFRCSGSPRRQRSLSSSTSTAAWCWQGKCSPKLQNAGLDLPWSSKV